LPNIAPPDADTCIVQLGRTGDVLNVLPIAAAFGCGLMAHSEFLPVAQGHSRVRAECWKGSLGDWKGAARLAAERYGRVIVTQLFPDRASFPHYTDCFAADEWVRCGVEYASLPLIFDRRDPARERALVERHDDGRPMLVVNVRGVSGRYPRADELLAAVRARFKGCNVVETPHVEPFYDLLGLYDAAAGVVTVDTATLHLCRASNVPAIQFLNDLVDPWLASRPTGNCVSSMRYSELLGNEDRAFVSGAVSFPDL
jgi:hypothetical protein